VLPIAPAAHHAPCSAQESEEFLPIARRYLPGATVFLALGMAADCYVIVTKVLNSLMSGVIAAAVTAVVCLGRLARLALGGAEAVEAPDARVAPGGRKRIRRRP
jgi:hypothetical protein